MKSILLLIFFIISLKAEIQEKTPSDVFSLVKLLRDKVILLRKESGINKDFPKVLLQQNKKPRHVIQKSLEVLTKINKYRKNKGFSEISIPLYPSRTITPSDVYYISERLNQEVYLLIKDKKNFKTKPFLQHKNKTPNDVYKELWEISLGFDSLLGRGFTPTDVYGQTQRIIKIVEYLNNSQDIVIKVKKPNLKSGQHPNHALYASIDLMSKISNSQKKLWMQPMEVPLAPQRVITPTEVYDSLQTIIAELQRIKRRIGVEKYFQSEGIDEEKTPSHVIQNLEYVISIFPDFLLQKELKQFDKTSLDKNSNDMYSLSEFILKKILMFKDLKGISIKPKNVELLSDLKPIHVYEKVVENLEKINRIKSKYSMLGSYIPSSFSRNTSQNQIFDLILMIDNELNILLKKEGLNNIKSWSLKLNKTSYKNKTPSDVYNNLWKISNLFDTILGIQYTPNETYILAKKIEQQIDIISLSLTQKLKTTINNEKNKQPSDVFNLSIEVYDILNVIRSRANVTGESRIIIPRDEIITPTTVYNSLRLVNATVNELRINFNIEREFKDEIISMDKSPSDVYNILNSIKTKLLFLLKDNNYEN